MTTAAHWYANTSKTHWRPGQRNDDANDTIWRGRRYRDALPDASGLPAIFAKRRANRGMEGMALDVSTDKIYGFLQSPLSDGNATYAVTGKSEAIERFARFTRWTEFYPVTRTPGKMYAYPLDASAYLDGRTGNAELTVLPWRLTTTTTLA